MALDTQPSGRDVRESGVSRQGFYPIVSPRIRADLGLARVDLRIHGGRGLQSEGSMPESEHGSVATRVIGSRRSIRIAALAVAALVAVPILALVTLGGR